MLIIVILIIILIFVFLSLGILSLIQEDVEKQKPFRANHPELTEDQNVNLLSHETLRRLKRILVEIDSQKGDRNGRNV